MADATPIDPEVRERARGDADRAAERARVEVRELTTVAEFDQARLVWDTAWPQPSGGTELTAHLVRALHHSGAYVSGAYEGDRIVAACLAFVGRGLEPDGTWHTHLHSHVAATMPGMTDRGLGTALKVHQRSWALDHGIDRIEWTFDPLVRRNARLNLVKLGGTAVRYYVDFYGAMEDGLNAGDESDRFILRWDIASDRVVEALDGTLEPTSRAALLALGAEVAVGVGDDGSPVVQDVDAPVRLVALPEDIVAMRGSDPAAARRWRAAVRAAVEPVVRAGGRAVSLTAEGDYVLEVGP